MYLRGLGQSYGANPALNQALAQATGYQGDFGSNAYQSWLATQSPQIQAISAQIIADYNAGKPLIGQTITTPVSLPTPPSAPPPAPSSSYLPGLTSGPQPPDSIFAAHPDWAYINGYSNPYYHPLAAPTSVASPPPTVPTIPAVPAVPVGNGYTTDQIPLYGQPDNTSFTPAPAAGLFASVSPTMLIGGALAALYLIRRR